MFLRQCGLTFHVNLLPDRPLFGRDDVQENKPAVTKVISLVYNIENEPDIAIPVNPL